MTIPPTLERAVDDEREPTERERLCAAGVHGFPNMRTDTKRKCMGCGITEQESINAETEKMFKEAYERMNTRAAQAKPDVEVFNMHCTREGIHFPAEREAHMRTWQAAIAAIGKPQASDARPLTPEGKPIFGEGSAWDIKSYLAGVSASDATDVVRWLREALALIAERFDIEAERHAGIVYRDALTAADQWLAREGA